MSSDFVKVATKIEVPEGKTKAVNVGGKDVLIVNVNGNFYAIALKCTHMGGDLSKGQLEGTIVTCPRHHAKYDVTNGKAVSPPKIPLMHPKGVDLAIFQVKIEQDDIAIKL
jgi:3-phenylpropionate/trans-cinnamate dioxygenase ferredoxin component